VLLFLGRFHPEKGLLRVLETFRALRSSGGGPWKLLLVGRDDGFQGALEGEIRKWKLENEARIVTNVYEQRFEFYRLASVFVGFPTMYEETMLSAVEALQCGTPVVVSREADMPFVDEAGAGFVIDYSCDEAAHKVAQVLNDLPGYERRAFSLAESQYSSQKSAGLFRGYLESQVRAHRGPAGGER
jgi:glycosyltransferase involved in cell wall biosynthesis